MLLSLVADPDLQMERGGGAGSGLEKEKKKKGGPALPASLLDPALFIAVSRRTKESNPM